MSDVNFVLTAAGAAALVNAANTGTDPVIISHCGVSAAALVPSAALTALPGEIKRISTLAGDVVAPDTIHLMVRDESEDVYTLRSLALYASDGTLFAIYGQAAPIMEKSAGAMLLLALDAQFTDVDAALISFGDTDFLNPPATETVQGVAEIATQAEANAGADDQRILTPKKGKAAQLPWLLSQDGAGSGVDADLLDGKHAAAFLELVNFTGAAVLAKLLTVDGAGSGIDGDTLDGQHGAYYADIPARLGFTPLNSTAFTAAAVLAHLLTVDGAGSGIDADTLDGQHGAYYANIPARLGFTPLNSTAYTAADVLTKMLTQDGAGSGLDADLLDGKQAAAFLELVNFTGAAVLAKLVAVDGSGSGLDADTVDGVQAAQFLQIQASSFGLNGYVAFTNGLKLQWGRATVNANGYTTITYPLAFSSYGSPTITSPHDPGNQTAQDNGAAVTSAGLTSFQIYSAQNTSTNGWWVAIGYQRGKHVLQSRNWRILSS